jgi:nitroreductase
MEFTQLIRRRESVRSYDPGRPLEQAVLTRILESGRVAPSAANRQPWRFLVVSSPEGLARVRRCYAKPWFQDAPHVLAVVGRAADAWTRQKDGYNSLETDLTIAMDHLILAAENEGVGTCWVEAYDPDVLREALALAADQRVFSITPLRYPRPDWERRKDKPRKPLAEIVKYL